MERGGGEGMRRGEGEEEPGRRGKGRTGTTADAEVIIASISR